MANYQRYEATTNYEFTQAEAHEVVAPGAIQRLSVAVMVDITSTQAITPLRAAIAAAAGIDATRGDTLAVEPLKFDRSYSTQQASNDQRDTMIDLILKVSAVVGAVLLLLVLLWYIQRLLANVRLASNEVWTPVMLAAVEAAEAAATKTVETSMSKVMDEAVTKAVHAIPAPSNWGAAAAPEFAAPIGAAEPFTPGMAEPDRPLRPAAPMVEEMTPQEEAMQRNIIKLAEDDPTTIADIIHMWLSEDERHNG